MQNDAFFYRMNYLKRRVLSVSRAFRIDTNEAKRIVFYEALFKMLSCFVLLA